MRLFGFCFLLILTTRLYAQNPVADFSFPAQSFCQNESIFLENTSAFSTNYLWDFCDQDFSGETETTFLANIPNAGRILGIDFVKYNGIWYAFATSWNQNKLFRLTFSNGVNSAPTEVLDLSNPDNVLNQPVSIHIVQDSNIWYGLVHNWGSAAITRITFGTDLLNTTLSGVAYVSGVGGFPAKMDVIEADHRLYASVIRANGSMTLIDLNAGLDKAVASSQMLTTPAITGVSSARDVELVYDHKQWYAFIASFTNGKVFRADFGDNLMTGFASTPVEVAANYFNGRINNIEITKSGEGYYLHVLTFEGGLFKVKLNAINDLPTVENTVRYGESYTYKEGYALTFLKESGQWYGFTFQDNAGANPKLYIIKSKAPCPVNTKFSLNESPTVYYTKPGQYAVNLTAYDSYGNYDDTTQYISITEDIAPAIDFTADSYCVNTDITLTGIADQQITAWQWIVQGDTLTAQVVSHNFTTVGSHKIVLQTTSENGCTNRLTKDITIYEPPVPSFTIPQGKICTNGVVAFTNQTNTQGAGSLVTYQWDFNGEGSSTAEHPNFVFTTGGTKTVTLTAGIPGCEQTYSQTVTIEDGPQVDFAVPFICQGAPTTFENLTTGNNITQYRWSFGDGGSYTSATAEAPVYSYPSTGRYTLTLTVENATGCVNTRSKQVTVYAQPQVAFLAEVACAGKPVRFTDQTTAGTNANVLTWQWDFGDGKGKANIRNPTYTYSQPGTYAVTLTTQTSAGCQASRVQQITVASPVTTAFSDERVCPAVGGPYTVLLSDESVVAAGDQLTSWLWRIQGQEFFTREVRYTFQQAGTYEVSLTAFAASACYTTITRTIEILPPPAVAFRFVPACAGEPFAFINETDTAGVAIDRYSWDFGGAGKSFETDASFAFATPGSYAVTLSAHTAEGCVYTAVQTVEVLAQPEAKFTPSAAFGGAPLLVQFDNQSRYASQYRWLIGADTLTAQSPSYTFSQPGHYTVTLQAQNDLGCVAAVTKSIQVVEPVWDVVLENVRLITDSQSGSRQIILTIRNAGTVAVTDFPVSIRIDQGLEVQEMFAGYLKPGERINHTLSFTLPVQPVSLGYLCATLLNSEGSLPDSYPADNRACVSMENTFSSLLPYPNPVKDVLEVSLILSDAQPVKLIVENAQGKQLQVRHYRNTKPGLNTFPIDCSGFPNGTYFIHIYCQGKKQTYRILVSA